MWGKRGEFLHTNIHIKEGKNSIHFSSQSKFVFFHSWPFHSVHFLATFSCRRFPFSFFSGRKKCSFFHQHHFCQLLTHTYIQTDRQTGRQTDKQSETHSSVSTLIIIYHPHSAFHCIYYLSPIWEQYNKYTVWSLNCLWIKCYSAYTGTFVMWGIMRMWSEYIG